MTDCALVIGINHYEHGPGWSLHAAVHDAVEFARWVTAPGAGRASLETLTLLLSPAPGDPRPELAYAPATEAAIFDAMYALTHERAGRGAERLWFFFAGHGLAPEGGGVDEAPIIVPADLRDLGKYLVRPLRLWQFLREMQLAPPPEQLYFIDACRGVVESEDVITRSQHLHFDLSKVKDVGAVQARQAVLYATTAGQVANESGVHGLFGRALLQGLAGRGPELLPDISRRDHVLTFDALVGYTKRMIHAEAEDLRRQRRPVPTQEPAVALFRAPGSLAVARFREPLPTFDLRVYVAPPAALERGQAGIVMHDPLAGTWLRARQVRPLPRPIAWQLAPGVHRVEIEAAGFRDWFEVVELLDDMTLNANLISEGAEYTHPTRPSGELEPGARGELVVNAGDPYARIEVFDGQNHRLAAGLGRLEQSFPLGGYRVDVTHPSEPTISKTVLVTGGDPRDLVVAPDTTLPVELGAALASLHMRPGMGFAEPSEQFGRVTTTHLGSLLAWAAWAARFDVPGGGDRLRVIGVDPLRHADPAGAYIQVLIGDTRPAGADLGPVETLALLFGRTGAERRLATVPVRGLPRFAVQWAGAVERGADSLRIEGAGLGTRSFPIHAVGGYVAVIVVAREASGEIEIHRYLLPVAPTRQGHASFSDHIRRVEQSWRALEARMPLLPGEIEAMLERPLDPLALAVFGYRLAREDRLVLLKSHLPALVRSGLPDGHVLAALASGDHDTHMQAALEAGLPAVSEGYRWLDAWLTKRAASLEAPPPNATRQLAGGIWTAFDKSGRAPTARAFAAAAAPAWAAPLRLAATATARLEPPGTSGPAFTGTAFLISDGVIATDAHCLEIRGPLGDASPLSGWTVAFEDGSRLSLEVVLARRDVDEATVVLARVATSRRSPVSLHRGATRVGQRIAVIGHPVHDGRIPAAAVAAAFTSLPAGELAIMPGVIVAVEPARLTYECWTMTGTSGGPIVDLETGEVIGMHHGGRYTEGSTKLGFGMPLSSFFAEPMGSPEARRGSAGGEGPGSAPLRELVPQGDLPGAASFAPLWLQPCPPRPPAPGLDASNVLDQLPGGGSGLLVVIADTRPDLVELLHTIALTAPRWTPERFTSLPWVRVGLRGPMPATVLSGAPGGEVACIFDFSDCPFETGDLAEMWRGFLDTVRSRRPSGWAVVGLPRWLLAHTPIFDWVRSQPHAFTMVPRYAASGRGRTSDGEQAPGRSLLEEAVASLQVANSNALRRALADAIAVTEADGGAEDLRLLQIAERLYQGGHVEDAFRLEIFARTHHRRGAFLPLPADIEPSAAEADPPLARAGERRAQVQRSARICGFLPRAHEAPSVGARVILGGGAGAGKTTALLLAEASWALPRSMHARPAWLPILLRADAPGGDLSDSIRQSWSSASLSSQEDPRARQPLFAHRHIGEWASTRLVPFVMSSPLLFLIDGVTERTMARVATWLREINAIPVETSVVIALRPGESLSVEGRDTLERELGEPHHIVRLSLRALRTEQLRELCVRYGVDESYAEAIAGPELAATQALRNPYLSTRFLRVARAGGELRTRSSFHILQAFVDQSAPNDELSLTLVHEVLPEVAYRNKIRSTGAAIAADLHARAVQLGLLDPLSNPAAPQFSHRLLEDFFASTYVVEKLRNTPDLGQLLRGPRALWAIRWEHVARMVLARADEPDRARVLEYVIAQDLRLANRCVMELEPQDGARIASEPSAKLHQRIEALGYEVKAIEESLVDAVALGFLDPRLHVHGTRPDLVPLPSSVPRGPVAIGRYPVTNFEFARFVRANGYTRRELWKDEEVWSWREEIRFPRYWNDESFNLPNAPVVGVTFGEAEAYCEWLTRESDDWTVPMSFFLPAVHEWDQAAGVVDATLQATIQEALRHHEASLPGGGPASAEILEPLLRQIDRAAGQFEHVLAFNQQTEGASVPRPIGLFPPSPSGCHDMIGHVWEWCVWSPPGATGERGSPVVKGGPLWHRKALVTAVIGGDFDPYTRFHQVGFRIAGMPRKVNK